MKKEFRLSLNVDGLISICYWQKQIQRTDWLQKVRFTQHAKFCRAQSWRIFWQKDLRSTKEEIFYWNRKFDVGFSQLSSKIFASSSHEQIL